LRAGRQRTFDFDPTGVFLVPTCRPGPSDSPAAAPPPPFVFENRPFGRESNGRSLFCRPRRKVGTRPLLPRPPPVPLFAPLSPADPRGFDSTFAPVAPRVAISPQKMPSRVQNFAILPAFRSEVSRPDPLPSSAVPP